ncbi:MAG: hypothetical protein EOP58_00720 [Sphingomonadales bacterium]|nr:MAG: hypothetical protein EOP58_00720 [Sphingomonadales bacterium]
MTASHQLAALKVERDRLNDQIKLIEEGERKAAYDACMRAQHLAVNEARVAAGNRQITSGEFHSGILADEGEGGR